MQTILTRCAVLLLLAVMTLGSGSAQTALQPPPLPTQHIVFVIDNSGSMLFNDPLNLRGVAAGMVLDAVELTSDVQAGLVMFSDAGETDGKLNPTAVIRQRLQAEHLPRANGATNMEDALTKAIGILGGSSASIKRIVLITDGAPEGGSGADNQRRVIRENLVPHAQRAGIQIFALGLTDSTDRAFLEQITGPTGGKTLVTQNQAKLLESAKELVGNLDNVQNIANRKLASSEASFQFELPAGADRARVTAILNQPQEFDPSEIAFSLAGPDAGDGGRAYIILTSANGKRVAAWTSFFSTQGKYTLSVTVSKRGAIGHLGLHVFVEALSDLRVKLTLTPPGPKQHIGDEVAVDVLAATGKGPVDAANLKVSGTVRTLSGGSEVIAFNGASGKFRVPDVAGRQTVVVRVETGLGGAEAHADYEALATVVLLESNREKVTFAKPLAPQSPTLEESFQLSANFPDANHQKPVKFSFTLTSPVGVAELLTDSGNALRSGTAQYAIPPSGQKLVLRIHMDPMKRLPSAGGNYEGWIEIVSKEAGDLTIPFQFVLQIPKFELKGKPKEFALWWDPHRERALKLGRLRTDLSEKSTFTAVIPDAIYDARKGTKIADLALRVGDGTPAPEPIEKGKLHYGPIDLQPGDGLDLQLVITPELKNGWETLPASRTPIEIEVESGLGMKDVAKPTFRNLGPMTVPVLGPRSRHGRDLAADLLVALGALIIFLLAWQKGRIVRRFWPFRPGSPQVLGSGPIEIGTAGANGVAALALPASGSPLDDTTVGHVSVVGRRQQVKTLGPLRLARPALAPGDELQIVAINPNEPEPEEVTIWGLQYIDYTAGQGEVEIVSNPARWTLGRLIRWNAGTAAVVLVLKLILGLAFVASVVYSLPLVESLFLG